MPEITPEESHAQARERAQVQKLTRLRATLDRNARTNATAQIQAIVDRLVRDGAEVPIRVLPIVRDRLPEICRDRTIAQVAPIVVDVHLQHSMTRDELGVWIQYLRMLGKDLHARGWPSPTPPAPQPSMRIMRGGGGGIVSEFDLAPLPPIAPLLPPREHNASVPAEDEAALKDLAL